MKKLTALILALMLTMSLPLPAQAAYEFELLYDATEKLDREMCWELGAVQLVELSDTYKTQLRVDVVNSLEDYTLEEYAQMFSESFEYGYGDTKDGILLMLHLTEDETGLTYVGYAVCCYGENKTTLDEILTLTDTRLRPWLNETVWAGDMEKDNIAFERAVAAFINCVEGFLGGELAPIATEPSAPVDKQGHYITDDTDLLTEEDWVQINDAAIDVSQKHNMGIHVAIVEDFAADGSETIQEAARKRYSDNRLGRGLGKDGILLMISKAEGHYTILPMGQCELLVGEQAIGELSDILIAEFDADRPSQGLLRYIDKCDDILSGVVEYTEEVLTPEPEPQEEENGIFTYAVIAAGLVLCYLIIRKPKKKNESTAKEQEDQP